MTNYVSDSEKKNWVIISPTRQKRPDSSAPVVHICPFCPGNEKETPPEVFRVGPGDPDTSGWLVRVVPNKYQITDIHEVIIHSPDHTHDIAELPREQVVRILEVYRDRYNAHRHEGQVIIFNNHGKAAGASLAHFHSQVAVVTNDIPVKTRSLEPVKNMVKETDHFSIYCPEYSEWPYETWITPKQNTGTFGDITAAEVEDLSHLLPKLIGVLKEVNPHPEIEFAYNYYISPTNNWFLRIIPQFIHRAGFEFATGISVNTVDPKAAATQLTELWKE